MNAVEMQGMEQTESVFRELFDRIRAGRDGGFSVPPGVIAQGAELLLQCGGLLIPHGKARAQRVRKHQHWQSRRAFQQVMNARVWQFDVGHDAYSSPAGILPRLAVARQ